jgi:ABC-type uncharacterized transport system involved in gliding motility auxiliary subunit
LEEQVSITSFFTKGDPRLGAMEELLEEYTYASNRVSHENVDPDLNPSVARQYEIDSYGTIVFESGGRRFDASGIQEQDITSGILRVSRDVQKKVYFLTGHRERDIQSLDRVGYSQARGALEDDGYVVEPLNLATADAVPADATVLILAAPQTPLLPTEREALRVYFNEGGKALILQDPTHEAGLNTLLADWQVGFGAGLIIDAGNSLLGEPTVPMVDDYPFSQITKDLPMTFFPLARPVDDLADQEDPPSGRTFTTLAQSGPRSWEETNMEDRQAKPDEGVDRAGPLVMAAILEQELGAKGKMRLILFGDSDFATNRAIASLGNEDLFANSISWLAEDEELIAIRPRPPQKRELFLNYAQSRLVGYISWLLLPIAVLAIGARVWWRRR